MLHEYHVIYSVRYYLRFHVTAVALGTHYPWIRGHALATRSASLLVGRIYSIFYMLLTNLSLSRKRYTSRNIHISVSRCQTLALCVARWLQARLLATIHFVPCEVLLTAYACQHCPALAIKMFRSHNFNLQPWCRRGHFSGMPTKIPINA
jgi:hypothetical protein